MNKNRGDVHVLATSLVSTIVDIRPVEYLFFRVLPCPYNDTSKRDYFSVLNSNYKIKSAEPRQTYLCISHNLDLLGRMANKRREQSPSFGPLLRRRRAYSMSKRY